MKKLILVMLLFLMVGCIEKEGCEKVLEYCQEGRDAEGNITAQKNDYNTGFMDAYSLNCNGRQKIRDELNECKNENKKVKTSKNKIVDELRECENETTQCEPGFTRYCITLSGEEHFKHCVSEAYNKGREARNESEK